MRQDKRDKTETRRRPWSGGLDITITILGDWPYNRPVDDDAEQLRSWGAKSWPVNG